MVSGIDLKKKHTILREIIWSYFIFIIYSNEVKALDCTLILFNAVLRVFQNYVHIYNDGKITLSITENRKRRKNIIFSSNFFLLISQFPYLNFNISKLFFSSFSLIYLFIKLHFQLNPAQYFIVFQLTTNAENLIQINNEFFILIVNKILILFK